MKIQVRYDKKADSVYLHFSDQKIASSRRLDARRSVEYSREGEIRGIRFLSASSGLKTDDLPHRSSIAHALKSKGIAKGAFKPEANSDNKSYSANIGDTINSRTKLLILAGAGVLLFTIAIIGDILLMKNVLVLARNVFILNSFVLTSMLGLVASVLGLIVTMFPTVFGLLLIFAWIILATGIAGRYEVRYASQDSISIE